MPIDDIVVIGASAGGVEALHQLVKTLPPDQPVRKGNLVEFRGRVGRVYSADHVLEVQRKQQQAVAIRQMMEALKPAGD